MKLITLKTFDNPYEAHLLRTKLESENIASYIFDDNVIALNPLYNLSIGGVKLKVNDFDLTKANTILEEFFNTQLTDDNDENITCPNCQSQDIYSGFKSMKGVKGILSAILSFVFMILPIYVKTVYKCKACDFEFKAS